ncbi:MAG TPA: AmmeMemoRadiSam system protein B [Vicinamibacterales bacterium]|nr:AmmeMemoRadiSam system protein B [Vicinamibacterales bacterium]
MTTRHAAVAGTWYPANPEALANDIDAYVGAASDGPPGRIDAIIGPHAGLMFSGSIAAWAYKAVVGQPYDVAILIGPSHFVRFEGVALYPEGAFATPFGPIAIDAGAARDVARADIVKPLPSAHSREHSLEMHLPFLRRLLPELPIVPMLMGTQDRRTIEGLGHALGAAVQSRRALIVASTDLSHYYDAGTAARLDGEVLDAVEAFDIDRLLTRFESFPETDRGRAVGCGIGPALAAMIAAREAGARNARVLKYGHSGEVSGDYDGVVGYMAVAVGTFDAQ